MLRRILTLAVVALGVGAASAQDAPVRMVVTAATPAPTEQVRLNVAMNFFVPGPAGMSEQAIEAQERARRTVYQMAVRECAVLRETIARDCHMESMNVNVSRHQGQLPEGFAVSANMTFRVVLK